MVLGPDLVKVAKDLVELGEVRGRLVGQLGQDRLVCDRLDVGVAGQVHLLDGGGDAAVVLFQDLAQARIVQLGKVLWSPGERASGSSTSTGRACLDIVCRHPCLQLVDLLLKHLERFAEGLQHLGPPPRLAHHRRLLLLEHGAEAEVQMDTRFGAVSVRACVSQVRGPQRASRTTSAASRSFSSFSRLL